MNSKLGSLAVLFVSCLLLFPTSGLSTTEYAGQTGKICNDCHLDPGGGGKLTNEGETFKDSLRIKGQYKTLNSLQRVIRFIIGYLHTITAIIWFGTILYVHIVLKPAYAAGGLPRGELMLGWGSIIIMAVTGTLLSVSRVPTWHMLFHTRFGILLTIKIVLFLIMVSTAVFVTFVVGPKLRKKREQGIVHRTGDMTSDELAQYDGKDGRPVYIAYNDIIYDVTSSKLWREGSHFKKHPAGNDLTNILKTAPHGEEKVLKMPAIGKLLREKEVKRPPHIILFYFFAYMNLVLIFSIVFIISLWRWW
ncbi:MAG: CopD family protein [Nitrospirae bacterium]|nr:CopD family protein [Nitrospirota bacterium]